MVVAGCGGDSSSSSTPTSPTSTAPPAASPAAFSLTGLVSDETGNPLSAVVVTVLDGGSANRSTSTDTAGRYTLTGLSSGGMTIRFQRTGYTDLTRSATVTSATTLNVSMTRSAINLSGPMTGTFAFTNRLTGQPLSSPLTASVTQNGTAISGNFTLPNGWFGSFQGTLSGLQGMATYQGSMTVSGLITSGNGRCNGTRSSVTGTATSNGLTLPAPGEWRWEECNSTVGDLTVTLTR